MSLSSELETLVRSGVRRIGEIAIVAEGASFLLHHHRDDPGDPGLECSTDPETARALSTHAGNGEYRVSKSRENLRSGWLLRMGNAADLLLALDHFYPAAVGLFLAHRRGDLAITHLRDKLDRQTGMYIGAKTISNAAARKLVSSTYGPGHRAPQRILWQIDAHTPLEDSPARRHNGFPAGFDETNAIPLLSREPDNLFVADCRRVAKEERKPSESH